MSIFSKLKDKVKGSISEEIDRRKKLSHLRKTKEAEEREKFEKDKVEHRVKKKYEKKREKEGMK